MTFFSRPWSSSYILWIYGGWHSQWTSSSILPVLLSHDQQAYAYPWPLEPYLLSFISWIQNYWNDRRYMYLSLSHSTLLALLYGVESVLSQTAPSTILDASSLLPDLGTSVVSSHLTSGVAELTTLPSILTSLSSATISGSLFTTSATLTAVPTTTSVPSSSSSAPFPPVGSIPRDYSPAGLSRLWDLVRGMSMRCY